MQFDANTNQTEKNTRTCNVRQSLVPVDSTGQMLELCERQAPQSLTLPIYYSFTVFGVCMSTRGHPPLNMFCARCFCKEHLKLNFNRFALAFIRLACPWVEHRPPPHKLRAQHLPTTAFTFPWSFHSFINMCCL